jgi:Fe-S-cluster containining protein
MPDTTDIYQTIAVASQTDATANACMARMLDSLDGLLALDLEGFAARRTLPAPWRALWAEALAAYDAYIDHILAAEHWQPTCRRGCSACCRHELARGVGALEALAIYDRVHGWPDVDDLYRQCVENAAAFQRLLLGRLEADPRPLGPDDERVLDAHLAYNALERPCAFLDRATGACRIYPVRPLVCRFFFNFSPADWCAPSHRAYLERDARGIDPHRAAKQRLDAINRRLGVRMLNFLSGAFATTAAEVMQGRPVGPR